MPRGITQAALAGSGNAAKAGETSNLRGQNVYNELFPQLSSEATNPQGIGAPGLAAENTANQQSIGGSNAAAAGEGNLLAARTRNAGAAQPEISETNRAGGRQLSQNAVGITAQNEQLKNQQQQAALRGLQGLYGTNMSDALGFGNLQNNFLGTALGGAKATQAAWNQNLQTAENAGAGLAKAFV